MSPACEIEAAEDHSVDNKHYAEENMQHDENSLSGCAGSRMIIGYIQLYHGFEG